MTVALRFKKTLVLAAAWAGAAIALPASAAVPVGITQQGRLLDSTGNPVNGEINFVFTIYDAASAGTSLWSESQAITVEDGYFSTRLGEDQAFPGDLFDGDAIFLGVKVGTDDEMTPRQVMASAPFAYTANNAVGAITPASVTVNGIEVVTATGTVPATVITGFSGLFSTTSAAGDEAAASSATATCGAGGIATGGSCVVIDGNAAGEVLVKTNEPTTTSGTPTGWACACQDGDINEDVTCQIEAHVICLTEGG